MGRRLDKVIALARPYERTTERGRQEHVSGYIPERVPKGQDIASMAHAIQGTANQLYAREGAVQGPWSLVHAELTEAARQAWARERSRTYEHLSKAVQGSGAYPGLPDAINTHIRDLNKTKGGATHMDYAGALLWPGLHP